MVLWEVLVRWLELPPWLLPGPVRIMGAGRDTAELLVWHTLHTLKAAALGTALAVGGGLVFGVLIHTLPVLRFNLYPLLVASQTVPTLVVAPLLTLWFGYGILPKVLLVGLACFFPVTVGVIDGLEAADQELVALARTMGASPARLFWKIRWPSSLPSLFTGLRVAITYSIIATVVAEWMGADAGLGVYLTRASHSYLTDRVFAAIVVISALSLLLFWAVNRLAAMAIPWYSKNNHESK
jgi:ABC-type nitrate/sulfonate/bicarbonate transport system permease component